MPILLYLFLIYTSFFHSIITNNKGGKTRDLKYTVWSSSKRVNPSKISRQNLRRHEDFFSGVFILVWSSMTIVRSHVSSAHFWPQNMLLGHFAQERICNLAKLISSPTSPPHFYSFLVQTTLWAHFCSREKRSTQLLLPQRA